MISTALRPQGAQVKLRVILAGVFFLSLLWSGVATAGLTVFTKKKSSRETKKKCKSRLSSWALAAAKVGCLAKRGTLISIKKKWCKREKRIAFKRYRAYVSFTCRGADIYYHKTMSRRNGSVPYSCSRAYTNWKKYHSTPSKLLKTCEGWGPLKGKKKYYAASHKSGSYKCYKTTSANSYSHIKVQIYCKKNL